MLQSRGALRFLTTMATPTITMTDTISPEERAAVIRGLVAYNDSQVGAESYHGLFVLARDGDALVGGLLGFTHWGWLFISHLWLAESRRGGGVGRQMMEAAEREAVRRGCRHVHCDTFDFQALPFYRRLGFEVFGTLEDYPPGHSRYFLQKRDLAAQDSPARAVVLETGRLILRRMTPADAPFMLETLNEPSFIRNVADRGVRTLEAAVDYIRTKIMPSYQQFGFGFYIVELKECGTPIGVCGLVKRETMDHVDIGYALLDRFSGNGYAYEAAAALMEHGRTVHGLNRIVGVTAPDNQRSIKLLERLGLRFERMVQLPGFEGEGKLFG